MADKKVSQLNTLTSADLDLTTDLLHVVDSSAVESKKITGRSFLESVVGLNNLNAVSLSDVVFVYSVADSTMYQATVNSLIQQVLGLNTYTTGWNAVSVANGWTQNSNGGKKSFTHNLGSTNLQISIFAAESATGDNAVLINGMESLLPDRMRSKKRYGANVFSVTSSSFTIQTGLDGYMYVNDGIDRNVNFSYVKVVCRI